VMVAHTILVSADSFKGSSEDTIDIGVDVIHPVHIGLVVFPTATVVRILARHGERDQIGLRQRGVTLHAKVRSLDVVETWLHDIVKDEREACERIERQLVWFRRS
ncbi:hypothetical protein Tco_1355857, partial [Tanacetum coccineum]